MIIAALAGLAGIDVTRPSKAAIAIESETVRKGARVAARTIENQLRRIPEALERKKPKTDVFRNCENPPAVAT